ncbi:MAG: COG1615 family transporter [Anaerolineales bacterium]|nr:COG1615 family transporter [Anaerolineales bacterium]
MQTQEREFSYPSGDQNVYTNYEGSGGVVLDSYLKRLAFALRLADVNMLLSQDFTPTSRVMLFRNITDRARHIAPFLRYDGDPYIVIGPDGQLYWLLDAYTTSDLFPYSEPIGDLNYIRNSVKIVVDAYNGTPTFYVVDPADPLIQSYRAIFPGLFTPLEDMPDWLRAHLRYPEDLFTVQARLFQTYHMRDVNVFYNKEDLWQTPLETFGGNTQPVEPYYVVLRLPGGTQDEYVLTQPFTPNNKDNLIAWLAGRSDGENYGQLVAYRFPKQELVFGPLQIEGRIDQDPEISAQLTLWSQSGSQVIRGNLLVLPIDNSLLYVEPLYLQAVNGQIPELKRVIVVSGDQVIMRETLAEGLQALFSESAPPLTSTESPTPPAETEPGADVAPAVPTEPLSDDLNQLALTASDHYEAAQEALQRGDWATYGEELEKMKAALDALVRLTGEP